MDAHRRTDLAGLALLVLLAALLAATLALLAARDPGQPPLRTFVESSDPTSADVLAGRHDGDWSVEVPAALTLQPGKPARWFRIAIPESEQRQVVAVRRVPMYALELFVPEGESGWFRYEDRFFEPDREHFAPNAHVFELRQSAPGRPAYLRVYHHGRVHLDVRVQDESRFRADQTRFVVAITACFTVLMVTALLSLLYWLRLGEAVQLAFFGASLALLLWQVFATGLAYLWWPGSADWLVPGSPSGFLVALGHALLLRFLSGYLRLPAGDPAAARAVQVGMYAFLGLAFAYFFPGSTEGPAVGWLATLLFGLLPLLVIVVLARRIAQGSRDAGLFLLGWLPMGVIGVMRTLVTLGWLAPGRLTLYGALAALAFLALVLAWGLGGRALEYRRQRDRALDLAARDGLTGALNRGTGETRLDDMFEAWRARRVPLALLFIDLDDLKATNDAWGHAAGDEVLRAAAERLQAALPARGQLVRWGGDEFVVLLPGVDVERASLLAQRLAELMRAPGPRFNDEALPLSASIGVACAGDGLTRAADLVVRADAAQYRAKQSGPGQVAVDGHPQTPPQADSGLDASGPRP